MKAMESGKFRKVVCRGEWADAPFRELRALGLIELTGEKCRMGRRIHRITHAGLSALKSQYAVERGGGMNADTRDWFRAMIQERRMFPRGSLDWQWRTNAARKYLNIIRGIPAKDW